LTPIPSAVVADLDFFKKPTCSNHKAANEVKSGRKNLDVTGVGACACARHGCFVPHTMVDFQKGEKYVTASCCILLK
jgi:hypothetical protein